jgi:hypothetical protein
VLLARDRSRLFGFHRNCRKGVRVSGYAGAKYRRRNPVSLEDIAGFRPEGQRSPFRTRFSTASGDSFLWCFGFAKPVGTETDASDNAWALVTLHPDESGTWEPCVVRAVVFRDRRIKVLGQDFCPDSVQLRREGPPKTCFIPHFLRSPSGG